MSSVTDKLLERWTDLCRTLGLQGDCAGAGRETLRRYSEPHRRYHNRDHLADCLGIFDLHVAEAQNALAVEMALWFHDAIYVVGASDNEERSADLAKQTLASVGASEDLIDSVRAMILATKHQVAPPPGDPRLVCDIDLSILGSAPDRYHAYAAAILAESGLSMHKFGPLRAAFLKGMLAKPHVYHTPTFRRDLEMAARQNMACEQHDLETNG